MVGFHLMSVLALAMVAYVDVVDGGCRAGVQLLGPIADEVPPSSGRSGAPAGDAWLDSLRRWRQRSAGRSAVRGLDGSTPVWCQPTYR